MRGERHTKCAGDSQNNRPEMALIEHDEDHR